MHCKYVEYILISKSYFRVSWLMPSSGLKVQNGRTVLYFSCIALLSSKVSHCFGPSADLSSQHKMSILSILIP